MATTHCMSQLIHHASSNVGLKEDSASYDMYYVSHYMYRLYSMNIQTKERLFLSQKYEKIKPLQLTLSTMATTHQYPYW